MVDGRSGGRGDGSGGEEYDWLYSEKGQGAARPPDDGDATRVIPQMSPSGSRPSDAPPSRIAPAPKGPPPSARRPSTSSGRRGPRPRLRWLLYLLLAWVVYLIVVPIYAWTTVSKVNADPAGHRPADGPGTNFLVVGSDARKGLPGQRTDTIMVLHTGSGPDVLMSIPRDSYVPVPGHGSTKINAAFAYGGPKLLVKTVEQNTGLYIDDYVEIGFRGLVDLVDAVGGIQICPKTAMKDPLAHLNIKKGCQEADGKTALGYSRSRHTQALGDIGRAQHQREVVSAIGHEVVSWKTFVNPFRYWHVMTAGAATVRVSDHTGPFTAAKFAYAMTQVNGKTGLTCGVPIADLYVHWDAQRAPELFKLLREDRSKDIGKSLCSPSGLPH